MRPRVLVLSLTLAGLAAPPAAAQSDQDCARQFVYAVNQVCRAFANGVGGLCQPVAVVGPAPACVVPGTQPYRQIPLAQPAPPTPSPNPSPYPPNPFAPNPYLEYAYANNPYMPRPYPQPYLPYGGQTGLPGWSGQPPVLAPGMMPPGWPTGAAAGLPPVLPPVLPVPPDGRMTWPGLPSAPSTGGTAPAAVTPIQEPTPPVVARIETPAAGTVGAAVTPEVATASVAQADPVVAAPPVSSPARGGGDDVAASQPQAESVAPVATVVAATPDADTAAPVATAAEIEDAFAHFEFDKAELTAVGRAVLDAWLAQAHPGIAVRVVGHADRIGPVSYNKRLSMRRAETVRQYLVDKGLKAADIEVVARGESDPLVSCPGKPTAAVIDCLAPNRRVEILPR